MRHKGSRTAGAKTLGLIAAMVTIAGWSGFSASQAIGQSVDKPVVYSGETLERSDQAISLIQAIPQLQLDQSDVLAQTGDGQTTVALMGLGTAYTLVLVDGRRAGDRPFDLNLIPLEAIERVEVTTGGGGTDAGPGALAGVVNIVTKSGLNGFQLDARYGSALHDNGNLAARGVLTAADQPYPSGLTADAGVLTVTALGGHHAANGLWDISVYANFRRADPVNGAQRDYQACGLSPSADYATHVCDGSQTGFPGLFEPLSGPYAYNAYTPTAARTFAAYDPATVYNYAPLQSLRRADTRYSAGGSLTFRPSAGTEVYLQNQFMNDSQYFELAPSGLFTGDAYTINCDNPLLSSGQAQTLGCGGVGPTDDVLAVIGRRNVEGPARRYSTQRWTERLVAGIRGPIAWGWTYDVSGQYLRQETNYRDTHDLSYARLQDSLEVVSVGGVPTCKSVIDGSDPACLPYDIFVPGGSNAAVRRFLEEPTFSKDVYEEWSLGLALKGDLGRLGLVSPWATRAPSLGVSGEYRRERDAYTPDAALLNDDLASGAIQTPVAGSFGVWSLKAEASAPLMEDRPGARSLIVSAAARWQDDSMAGHYRLGRAGLSWTPVKGVDLFGQAERSAREPAPADRFTADQANYAYASDPCAGTLSAAQTALCRARFPGVNPALFGSIPDCAYGFCNTLIGGNVGLKPVLADIVLAGVRINPAWAPKLEATLKVYDLRTRGSAAGPDIGVIPQCLATGSPIYCSLLHRDPVTGGLSGAGYVDLRTNSLLTSHNQGAEIGLLYRTGLGAAGRLRLDFNGVLQTRSDIDYLSDATTVGCAGYFSNLCYGAAPRWRHVAKAVWTTPWAGDLALQWRFIGPTRSLANTANPLASCGCQDSADAAIRPYSYIDLDWVVEVTPKLSLRLTVDNLFDVDPPVLSALGNGQNNPGLNNTIPTVYDTLGRTVSVGLTARY